MSFDDVVQADLDGTLLSGEVADSVQFLSDPGSWSSPFNAFVREGALNDVIDIGFAAERGPEPIHVILSKTDVPIAKKKDKVRWQSREYAVKAVLRETAASWLVYCVQ